MSIIPKFPSIADPSIRKILHIFPSFEVGGAQLRFIQMAKGLGPEYQHTVLTMHPRFGAAEYLDERMPVDVALAPQAPGLLGRLRVFRAEIARHSPAALVTYNWGAIEWAAASLGGPVPHIHVVDGFGSEEASGQLRRRVLARRFVLNGSRVVVPSTKLRDIAVGTWRVAPQSVIHIPNGIEPRDHFQSRLDSVLPDLAADRPRIVWAGAMRREKNLPRLLRAFQPLGDQATLVLIGDGPERPAVEREIAALGIVGSVHLIGHRTDARELIMQCDLMALSSDTEQMPLAVLEAMDAGLPIAATDVGDVQNMVAAENRSFIIKASDAELTTAMRNLVADAALRARLGEANRRRARSDFSLQGMCAAYRALFTN